MMQDRTKQKYKDIKADFIKLTALQFNGKRKFTNEYVFEKLAAKYYLSTKTIEDIVFYRYNL